MRLRVISYNIRHGLGSDGKQDLPRVLSVLAESRADLICLQEVDRRLPRSGFLDQADWLASGLGFSHSFACNFGLPSAGMGNAILSRWPIYSTWNKRLPFRGEPRGVLVGKISLPEAGDLAVLCTHWGLQEPERLAQARATCRVIEKLDIPCLLAGDLNAFPSAPEIALLDSQTGLAWEWPSILPSYPAMDPTAQIDHIRHPASWRLLDAQTVTTQASDHLPLVADLETTA